MLQKIADVNFLAVLIAGLGSFFLGAAWYMPLFGKTWRDLHGYTEERVKEMQTKMKPAIFFGGMIVSYLVAALAMAFLVVCLDLSQAGHGMVLAFFVWLIVAAAAMTNHLASERHIGIYAIDNGFFLVFLMFMGVLLTLWR